MSTFFSYQINLLHSSHPAAFTAISDDDLSAYNTTNELLDGFLDEEYPVHIITCYDEFVDWVFGSQLENLSIDEFDRFVEDKILWNLPPTDNDMFIDILTSSFRLFVTNTRDAQVKSQEPENVITLNGKRYKLVEI